MMPCSLVMGANISEEPAGHQPAQKYVLMLFRQSKPGTSDVIRLPHQISPSFPNYIVTYSKKVHTQRGLKQTYYFINIK